jgi:hypothetical protein
MKEVIHRLSVAAVGRYTTFQNPRLILTAIRQFSQKFNPFMTKIYLNYEKNTHILPHTEKIVLQLDTPISTECIGIKGLFILRHIRNKLSTVRRKNAEFQCQNWLYINHCQDLRGASNNVLYFIAEFKNVNVIIYLRLRLRLLCGAGGYPPNVLQLIVAYCTNPVLVSPFHLQRRSTSDGVRDLYQRPVELWARNVRSNLALQLRLSR